MLGKPHVRTLLPSPNSAHPPARPARPPPAPALVANKATAAENPTSQCSQPPVPPKSGITIHGGSFMPQSLKVFGCATGGKQDIGESTSLLGLDEIIWGMPFTWRLTVM